MDKSSMSKITERFFRYISVDTQSDETTGTHPSTPGQFTLCRLLADEMRELQVRKVRRMPALGYGDNMISRCRHRIRPL